MSLIKYRDRRETVNSAAAAQNQAPQDYSRLADPASVHWHRSDLDGLPFRGKPELYRSEEIENRLVTTSDAKNGTFYTGDPEANAAYLAVMDRAANGWFSIVFRERWRDANDKHHYVYVEWLENYVEDGKLGT